MMLPLTDCPLLVPLKKTVVLPGAKPVSSTFTKPVPDSDPIWSEVALPDVPKLTLLSTTAALPEDPFTLTVPVSPNSKIRGLGSGKKAEAD
jgi:hypothetical protein